MNRSEMFRGENGKEKRTFACSLDTMADGQMPPLFPYDTDTAAQPKLWEHICRYMIVVQWLLSRRTQGNSAIW